MYYLVIILFILVVLFFSRRKRGITTGPFMIKESELIKNNERGLFASRDYKEGDLIENCPTLMVSMDDINYPNKINDYVFESNVDDHVLIPFGYCGLINHSDNMQNCSWDISSDNSTIRMYAVKDIKYGEELYTNYGNEYWNDRDNISLINF